MTRPILGIIGGIAFGSISVAIMLPMEFSDKTAALTAAFVSRFTIGLATGSSKLPLPAWRTGLIFGILVSLPDAMITSQWVPILSFGVVEGLVIGIVVARFGIEEPAIHRGSVGTEPIRSTPIEGISDAELEVFQALCTAASPEPWTERVFRDIAHALREGSFRWACSDLKSGKQDLFEGEVGVVMIMKPPETTKEQDGYRVKGIIEVSGPDARFIAKARKILPRLLVEIRRLRELLAAEGRPHDPGHRFPPPHSTS